MKPIRRVAVLGAGTMGARIAAHLANAQVPSLLLDLTAEAAAKGLDAAVKGKPGAFFTPEQAGLVSTGSFDADLHRIEDCDWIIEAVSENLEIKRSLLWRVAGHRRPGAVVSTNTSGIPLRLIEEGFPPEFCEHFLGIHFFNPPRYLHLVEQIAGAETKPEILAHLALFCDLRLGKGVVPCRDTPNFIANRIGCFFSSTVQRLTVEHELSIEEVDLLTGALIGIPKSASYRLLDVVGIDVWAHVTSNLYEGVPDDPFRSRFTMQPFLQEMIARGWIGEKAGQGCYKRVGNERNIHAIDWKTLEYHPAEKPCFDSLEGIRKREPLSERFRAIVALNDRPGRFLWQTLRDHMIYAASMVPQISDRTVEIDRAMRWGYGHSFGPFELWDALGFEPTARRMEAEGVRLPDNVQRMLSWGARSFYRAADVDRSPGTQYFDLASSGYRRIEEQLGIEKLSEIKRARGVVKANAGASLIDLGDGVLCCEFHSKMNSIGENVMQMIRAGLEELEGDFDAMVLGNQGQHFSAGADLMMILLAARDGKWDELNTMIHGYQQLNMALKYAAKPVVSAPFNMTLGGGCETAMHCTRMQASAELYMGLVEVGVGLIPAGGGCKEMLMRSDGSKEAAKKLFGQIGYAKVSGSAAEARAFGYLRERDGISMNQERLIDEAKQVALSLTASHAPGLPAGRIAVSGEAGFALMKMDVWNAREGRLISEHDGIICEKLAWVLSGGGRREVSEQDLLDVEREAFLSLCGLEKSRQRVEAMLKTGKSLRN